MQTTTISEGRKNMVTFKAIRAIKGLIRKGICCEHDTLDNECLCYNEASGRDVMVEGEPCKEYDISPVNIMSAGLDSGNANSCSDPFAHTLSEALAPYGVSSAKLYRGDAIVRSLGQYCLHNAQTFVILDLDSVYVIITPVSVGTCFIQEKEYLFGPLVTEVEN